MKMIDGSVIQIILN